MYKALKTFSGKVTMVEGEIKDILDKDVVNDLLRCKYIEEIVTDQKVEKKVTKKGKKTPVKGG